MTTTSKFNHQVTVLFHTNTELDIIRQKKNMNSQRGKLKKIKNLTPTYSLFFFFQIFFPGPILRLNKLAATKINKSFKLYHLILNLQSKSLQCSSHLKRRISPQDAFQFFVRHDFLLSNKGFLVTCNFTYE